MLQPRSARRHEGYSLSDLRVVVAFVVCMLATAADVARAASAHSGQVTFGGLPVPGAVVTIVKGDEKRVTVSDAQGEYQFADLSDGAWTIRIEMLGFVSIADEVNIPAASPSTWPLTLRTFEELAAMAGPSATEAADSAPALTASAVAAASDRALIAATPSSPGPTLDADLSQRAADGLLVNGSVNNGAASPFAQLAAFGNNRRGIRSLYNGGVGIILGNSAFDARSYSFNDTQNTPKPSYSDVQFAGTFGGPISIPRLVNRLGLFALYQRTSDHTANTQPALMPTALERAGDFSATRDANGRPVQIRDPRTGLPFPGNVIPRIASARRPRRCSVTTRCRMSPSQALDYERTILTGTEQDSVQVRVTQPGFGRDQMFGSLAYQRTADRHRQRVRLRGYDRHLRLRWRHQLVAADQPESDGAFSLSVQQPHQRDGAVFRLSDERVGRRAD